MKRLLLHPANHEFSVKRKRKEWMDTRILWLQEFMRWLALYGIWTIQKRHHHLLLWWQPRFGPSFQKETGSQRKLGSLAIRYFSRPVRAMAEAPYLIWLRLNAPGIQISRGQFQRHHFLPFRHNQRQPTWYSHHWQPAGPSCEVILTPREYPEWMTKLAGISTGHPIISSEVVSRMTSHPGRYDLALAASARDKMEIMTPAALDSYNTWHHYLRHADPIDFIFRGIPCHKKRKRRKSS